MPGNEHDNHDHGELHEQPPVSQPAGGALPPEQAGSQALSGALRVSFRFLKWAMVALVIVYLATGLFQVNVNEVKFKLRFGELVPRGSTAPLRAGTGWHLRWPWEVVVPVTTDERTLTADKDFWATAEAGPDIRVAQVLNVRSDGYLLTGDANIVHMKLAVRYHARDDGRGAAAYAFLVQNPEEILSRIVRSAVVKVVGSMPVMDVIGRKGLTDNINLELQKRLAAFEKASGVPLGIEVVGVQTIEQESVKNPTEPGAAKQAFFDAQNAMSRRNAFINEGQTEAEKTLNEAEARSAETLAEARGYATRMVRSAKADATQMEQLLPVFEHSQQEANMLLEDFYQRTMVEVLSISPGAFVLHEQPEGSLQQLRVNFTKPPVPKKPTAGANNQQAPAGQQP